MWLMDLKLSINLWNGSELFNDLLCFSGGIWMGQGYVSILSYYICNQVSTFEACVRYMGLFSNLTINGYQVTEPEPNTPVKSGTTADAENTIGLQKTLLQKTPLIIVVGLVMVAALFYYLCHYRCRGHNLPLHEKNESI